MNRRLELAIVAIAAAAPLALAPSALASTLSESGGVVTWTAAPAISNNTTFSDTATTMTITTTADPVIYDSAGNTSSTITSSCADSDGAPMDGTAHTITCTGVSTIHANSLDLNDSETASSLTNHPITIDAGSGDDNPVYGGAKEDTLYGGDGNDSLRGNGGSDVVDGQGGDDRVFGDTPAGLNLGNDIVRGGDGRDRVHGGKGDDNVDGGPGDDFEVGGGGGTDVVNGGTGDDFLRASNNSGGGPTTVNGGDGQDTLEYDAADSNSNDVVNMSLDNQANDGLAPGPGSTSAADNQDNWSSDIEMFVILSDAPTHASGDAAPSTLTISGYNTNGAADTVDMGAGPDSINTGDADDTVSAVDGFPDTVNCGPGTDTASVDQFDTVFNCETVNRSQVPSAFAAAEDAPPQVSWVSPAVGSHGIPSGTATTLEVAAADDKGVSKVEFYVGSRLICTVTAAPYRCTYLPAGTDIGRNTLVAVAYDGAGQTATALNQVIVPRFNALSLVARTRPSKDTAFPFHFTTTGKLTLPANVAAADGCKGGFVVVQFRAGKKTISSRRVGLQKNCSYRSAVTFKIPARLHPKTLNVLVRFGGNETMNPKQARTRKVSV